MQMSWRLSLCSSSPSSVRHCLEESKLFPLCSLYDRKCVERAKKQFLRVVRVSISEGTPLLQKEPRFWSWPKIFLSPSPTNRNVYFRLTCSVCEANFTRRERFLTSRAAHALCMFREGDEPGTSSFRFFSLHVLPFVIVQGSRHASELHLLRCCQAC